MTAVATSSPDCQAPGVLRGLLTYALLFFLLVGGLAVASTTLAQDAGPLRFRTRVERPPEGSLRRGPLSVPGWVVYAGGGLIVVAAAGALAWRIRRDRP